VVHNWETFREWTGKNERKDTIPDYDWYRSNGGILGLEPTPDWFVAHLVEFFHLAKTVVKPSGSIWVNLGDTYFARWASIRDKGRQGLGGHPRERRKVPMGGYRQEKQLLLIPSRFAIAMQEDRWIVRNDVIWHKPNVPPRPEKDRLRLAHEHFFHFVHRPTQGRARYYYDLSHAERHGNDVVSCFVQRGEAEHTATFPEQLILPRILTSCPLGGTVLDPFAGTGRALAVAIRSGMNAIGFDLSRKYFGIAEKMLLEAAE
jgi:site-specific DNA-methyltransferase (cytosine-N4-specific)